MKQNKTGFSIVIAMGIVLLITLLAFTILEYIIPFGRNVKGIENSSKAYYQAESGIEQALYDLANNQTGYSFDSPASGVVSYGYTVAGNGPTLPPVGEGNSEYDADWNIIAPGQPIQLEIGNNVVNWNNAKFYFRKPNIGSNKDLDGGAGAIINWQLASELDIITASGAAVISAEEINDYVNDADYIDLRILFGSTLESGDVLVDTFYGNDCNDPGEECTLKFSIVNPLVLEADPGFTGIPVPYLEWKFDFGAGAQIPLRYAGLSSEGKSYGFKKSLEIKIPQQTIVEAFDFTVFQ